MGFYFIDDIYIIYIRNTNKFFFVSQMTIKLKMTDLNIAIIRFFYLTFPLRKSIINDQKSIISVKRFKSPV